MLLRPRDVTQDNTRHVGMKLHLLFVCCEMNCGVGEQPETRGEISFPKSSKSLILVDEKEALPETPLTVKSAHLTLYFNHLQGRSEGFTENPGEPHAHEALGTRQPVVFFNRGHPYPTLLRAVCLLL